MIRESLAHLAVLAENTTHQKDIHGLFLRVTFELGGLSKDTNKAQYYIDQLNSVPYMTIKSPALFAQWIRNLEGFEHG